MTQSQDGVRSPVALMIFNRPQHTQRVFEEIAKARPQRLLVIADGPRPGNSDDVRLCADARAIVEKVDWDCEVLKNYADINQGCAHRPSSGLSWVFEQVDEAIILEDDCVPHPSFFKYCDDLLGHYRYDERVMHISGNNFFPEKEAARGSFSFCIHTLSWGWATWRRAFQHYDFHLKLWPELRDTNWLMDILGDRVAADHWKRIFELTYTDVEKVNTWDFQWLFACWAQGGLSVIPNRNLVSNIGYGKDATHTKHDGDAMSNRALAEMNFPLKFPAAVIRDFDTDRAIADLMLGKSESSSDSVPMLRRAASTVLAAVRVVVQACLSKTGTMPWLS
jgi:hypothetical protein